MVRLFPLLITALLQSTPVLAECSTDTKRDLATASLNPEESQMELEAYALQNQGPLVAALLNSHCSQPKG